MYQTHTANRKKSEIYFVYMGIKYTKFEGWSCKYCHGVSRIFRSSVAPTIPDYHQEVRVRRRIVEKEASTMEENTYISSQSHIHIHFYIREGSEGQALALSDVAHGAR